MASNEVVIRISAKNLTAAEFKKARASVLGLGTEAETTGKKAGAIERGFGAVAKSVPGALRIVGAAAGIAAGAIAAVTGAVVLLGRRGSELAGVQASFQRLATMAGESGAEIVRATKEASQGLVTNLEIMTAANKGLLLGLPITATEMGNLAKTATVLGRAMKVDASTALNDLITGLGRASPLILDNLGITVKAGEAQELYAAKLGKSSSALTDAEKKTAFYEAALAAANTKVAEIGESQLTLGERVRQTFVFFTDLTDTLSIAIAQSPVFTAGVGAINDMLQRTFGEDQQGLVLGIVNFLEKGALTAVEFGKAGITAAGFISRGFAAIKVVVLGVALALSEGDMRIRSFAATALEIASKIPGIGGAYEGLAEAVRSSATASAEMNASLRQQVTDAAIAAAGNDKFGLGLQTARTALDEISLAMTNAGLSQREMTTATKELTAATGGGEEGGAGGGGGSLSGSLAKVKLDLEALAPVMVDWQGKLIETSAESTTWAEIVGQSFAQTTTASEGFGAAVVGVGDLASLQSDRMALAFENFGLRTRSDMQRTVDQMKQDFETIKASGVASAEQLEVAWQKYEEARALVNEESGTAIRDQDDSTVSTISGNLSQLGSQFKGFAIAAAGLDAAAHVIKTISVTPWPISIGAAIAAAAQAAILVSRVKSAASGFREGTPNQDFVDFGAGTPTVLHGREAVISEGSVGALADQIAAAVSSTMAGAAGPNVTFAGPVYGFDDFAEKVGEIMDRNTRRVRDRAQGV